MTEILFAHIFIKKIPNQHSQKTLQQMFSINKWKYRRSETMKMSTKKTVNKRSEGSNLKNLEEQFSKIVLFS